MKNKIKIERAIHGLTQETLAKRACVSRQTINAIERNKYVPSTILAMKIARIFNKSVEEIFILEEDDMENTELKKSKARRIDTKK